MMVIALGGVQVGLKSNAICITGVISDQNSMTRSAKFIIFILEYTSGNVSLFTKKQDRTCQSW